ncbi:MAG: sodium:proton antiporter [Lachnospiraceae bacterium]|nr:sodium:proton antiporter [Lachnospiraceae bacterium]
MTDFLTYAVILLSLIVLIGFFNEKKTKLTYEIALMLFSILIGTIVTVADAFITSQSVSEVLYSVQVFDLEDFLMKGVLCFMLFAGSCHMKLSDFRRLARPVGVLAVICTLLGAIFYGILFYLAALLLKLPFTIPMCLMFGSIVAPTDPIAATSILNKFGLPKDISFLIEGESLLNDGVGVALFVCFSGIVKADGGEGFFTVMFREILGAVLIGAVVTSLCFLIFSRTQDAKRQIFTSLLAVSFSYFLCEHFECSGAIASVVCGVLFAAFRDKERKKRGEWELPEFDGFWEILDNLLNSILYVILGFSFIRILQMPYVLRLSVIAVACNLLGRLGSLYISSFIMGPIPDGFDRASFVKLLTWGGLRGGLSIALAMSTASMLSSEDYHVILGCTYAIVFFTTIIQGLSMKRVYDRIAKGRKANAV